MTALAAACTDDTHNGVQLVQTMLSAMNHRGSNIHILQENENITLGLAEQSREDGFIKSDDFSIALDGTFYANRKWPEGNALQLSLKGFKTISSYPGCFSLLSSRKNKLYAVRDPNGLKPLYYSQDNHLIAIASERKALWRIGAKHVNRILPGYVYTVSKQQLRKKRVYKMERCSTKRMTMKYASTHLRQLLINSTKLITNDVKRVAVAFSGGLDSSVTALLAKRRDLEVELISTGLEGSQELQIVENFARRLNLPITIRTYDSGRLEEYVRRILWLVEEPDLMRVSIAIPLYWAASLASERGHTVLLCGQGSDELYGGYARYARILDSEGPRALSAELYRSLIESPQVNYERDEQATNLSGISLRTPFANLDVINFSLRIPLEFKVKKGNDVIRKWVLREVARTIDLPESMVWRRKKAIQHGTGVENAIRRLAKTHQLTPDSYLVKSYETIQNLEVMP